MRLLERANPLFGAAFAAALILAPVSAAYASPQPADPNAPRAWTFWQSDGLAWLATPAESSTPKDGAVLGWRFSATPDGPGEGDSPREVLSFDQVCGKAQPPAGQKRVAVAVDFGDADVDAYPGDTPPSSVIKCVVAPEGATSLQVLSSAGTPRVDAKGAVLAVAGYPAKAKDSGTTVTAAPAPADTGGSSLPLILGGAGALVVIAGAGVILARRRR
jgi:hypothetical protein